jgi:hypothetical protein
MGNPATGNLCVGGVSNSVLEAGETCDGTAGLPTCATAGGMYACNQTCSMVIDMCTTAGGTAGGSP